MINGKTLTADDLIYTHIDHVGRATHIHAERLRLWCIKTKQPIHETPVRPQLLATFYEQNSIDPARVIELALREHLDPIIFCKTGSFTKGLSDVFLADGHHRYALAIMQKRPLIKSWAIEKRDWRQFRIYNLPKETQEQLTNIPILPRSY